MRKHRRLTFRPTGQINVTNRLSGDPMEGGRLDGRPAAGDGGTAGAGQPLRHAPGDSGAQGSHPFGGITAICQWSKKDAKSARFEQDRPSAAFTERVASMSAGFNHSLLGRARLS